MERASSGRLEANLGARLGENGHSGQKIFGQRCRRLGICYTRFMAKKNDLEAALEKGVAHREETGMGARKEVAMERGMGAGMAHGEASDLAEREERILGREENRNRENRKGQSVGERQKASVEE